MVFLRLWKNSTASPDLMSGGVPHQRCPLPCASGPLLWEVIPVWLGPGVLLLHVRGRASGICYIQYVFLAKVYLILLHVVSIFAAPLFTTTVFPLWFVLFHLLLSRFFLDATARFWYCCSVPWWDGRLPGAGLWRGMGEIALAHPKWSHCRQESKFSKNGNR